MKNIPNHFRIFLSYCLIILAFIQLSPSFFAQGSSPIGGPIYHFDQIKLQEINDLLHDGNLLDLRSSQFRLIDVDNDNDLDLSLQLVYTEASPIGDQLRLFRNNGNNSFTFLRKFDITGYSGIWKDYDGDGDVDLILRREGKYGMPVYQNQTISVIPNPGKGSSPISKTGAKGRKVLFKKITVSTGRGVPDLVMEHHWANWNKDKYPDLYVTKSTQANGDHFIVFANRKGQSFQKVSETVVPTFGGQYFKIDGDNDGDTDVMHPRGPLSTFHKRIAGIENGFLEIPEKYSWAVNNIAYGSYETADFNRDGREDIAVVRNKHCFVYFRDEEFEYKAKTTFDPTDTYIYSGSPVAVDLDKDGDKELILTRVASSRFVYPDPRTVIFRYNDGKFKTNLLTIKGTLCDTGDIDGDGDQDLLIMIDGPEVSDRRLYLYLNEGLH